MSLELKFVLGQQLTVVNSGKAYSGYEGMAELMRLTKWAIQITAQKPVTSVRTAWMICQTTPTCFLRISNSMCKFTSVIQPPYSLVSKYICLEYLRMRLRLPSL